MCVCLHHLEYVCFHGNQLAAVGLGVSISMVLRYTKWLYFSIVFLHVGVLLCDKILWYTVILLLASDRNISSHCICYNVTSLCAQCFIIHTPYLYLLVYLADLECVQIIQVLDK